MTIPKVSIIIPVYNVEKYIERCVRTLFAQTLDELEYIFVDDCSPDKSIEVMLRVLEDYPARKSQVKLIRHECNQGVSQSRQDGVDAATGEYIIHCDPDDWVELDMYEQLYNKAKETNADIVGCDFYDELEYSKNIHKQDFTLSNIELVQQMILGKSIEAYLWERLISHKFYVKSNIRFSTELSLFEDMAFLSQIHLLTNNVVYIQYPLYHYNHYNSSSIVNTIKSSNIDSAINALEQIKIKIGNKNIKLLNAVVYRQQGFIFKYVQDDSIYNPQKWKQYLKKIDFTRLSKSQKISYILGRLDLNHINYLFAKVLKLYSSYKKNILNIYVIII